MNFALWLQAIQRRSLRLYDIDFIEYFHSYPFRRDYAEGRSAQFMTSMLTKWIPYWKGPSQVVTPKRGQE